MKAIYIKIVLCLVAFSFAFTNTVNSQIFLDGVVYDYTEEGGPVQVTVFKDGVVTKETETNNKGKYRVRLQPNHSYTIAHSKKGFYTSQIAVHTNIPYEENNSEFFKEILVEIDLVEDHVEMDPATMRKPLSVFTYNEKTGLFVQNDDNLQSARNELEAFLYEADEVDPEDTELADADTDKEIEEDVDPLEGINFDTVEVYTAAKNTEKKTYKQLDDEERARKEREERERREREARNRKNELAAKTNNNNTTTRNNATASTNNQNNQLVDTTSQDTIAQDTVVEEIPEPTELDLRVKINGEEYDPNQQTDMVIEDDEVNVEILGLPNNVDYTFVEYKLSGRDETFQILDSDDIEFDNLEAGNYTFHLRSTSPDITFRDIEASFELREEESDNTWIYIVLGVIAAIIIVVLVTRKKKEEDREDLNDRNLR